MTDLQVPPRLHGAFNFRDLGGLPTTDGGRIRSGRLFRSDTLQALTEDDVAHLVDDLGIAGVVDLRSPVETVEEGRGAVTGHPGQKLTYVNVPLGLAPVRNQTQEVDATGVDTSQPGALTAAMYVRQLDEDASVPRAVELVAVLTDRPTVVHCAVGKDRTGVITALVLLLVGVDEETVVRDYMETATNIDRMIERLRGWPRYAGHMGVIPDEFYRVEEHAIRGTLAELNARYGGAAGWARDRLRPGVIGTLRTHLVEHDTP